MDNYDLEIPDNTPKEIKRMLFLWVAVISKAIDDLHSKSEFNSMRAYIWFTDTSNEIGSFSWICTLMNINAYSYLKEPLITTAKKPPITTPKRPDRKSVV